MKAWLSENTAFIKLYLIYLRLISALRATQTDNKWRHFKLFARGAIRGMFSEKEHHYPQSFYFHQVLKESLDCWSWLWQEEDLSELKLSSSNWINWNFFTASQIKWAKFDEIFLFQLNFRFSFNIKHVLIVLTTKKLEFSLGRV